jgi:shikimate dehydrogenase
METTHRAACVIGYPARHSRSPKLHGYWIQKYGLDAAYRAEEIPPEDVVAFISDLAGHGYVGANVTMPHKDVAFELSEPDERATAVGAANTLWLEDGVLRATNTDIEGFISALDAAAPAWDRRTSEAIVLGAGGAARAVIYGLIERAIPRIHVVNRTLTKAEALRERYGAAVAPATWDELPALLARAQLLTNATSLGMHDNPPLEIDITAMPSGSVVSDIVYVPLTTPLLAAAQAHGLATSNGLDMLLHQAVRGFELWFGIRPEVTRELYDLLAADIEPA